MKLFNFSAANTLFFLAIVGGVAAGLSGSPVFFSIADSLSHVFLSLLKLVSLPIIFLSLLSTATGMDSFKELKTMGRLVAQYTIITTIFAAFVALGLFLLLNPIIQEGFHKGEEVSLGDTSYLTYLLNVIPSNILQPFVDNNVIGVLILALLLSFATLALPDENRKTLHHLFKSLFMAVMKITQWIVKAMPIAIFAFIILFIRDLKEGLSASSLALYLIVVVSANLVQALIVLPSILKFKGISPVKIAKGMLPALSVAFFSKSSSAALPMAVDCAENTLKIPRRVAAFSLPLCTTINMNACAAFILSTVLFVSMSQGVQFSYAELIGWVFVATIAAVGNAGVPMGCYFLSGAILASMNVPLQLLGAILPFYGLIDMLESAINVWSDSCVTALVDKDLATQESTSFGKENVEQLA
jgi:Na+/H+-dicarboxylate symporter